MNSTDKDPKQRLKEAALRLFAQKGFEGVGLREIATEADVNVAMISYYFGGKTELMKAFIDEYHEKMREITLEKYEKYTTVEDTIRETLKGIIAFTRLNPELCMVSMNETNFSSKELHDYRIERVRNTTFIGKESFVNNLMKNENITRQEAEDKFHIFMAVVGSAFSSILYISIVHKSILKDAFGVDNPDKYDDFFTELVLSFFVRGVGGVIKDFKFDNSHRDNTEEIKVFPFPKSI